MSTTTTTTTDHGTESERPVGTAIGSPLARAEAKRSLAARDRAARLRKPGAALSWTVTHHVREALGVKLWQEAHRAKGADASTSRPLASESEVEALAQTIVLRLLGRAQRPDGRCARDGTPLRGRGRAADVLSWIDRAERFPALARRECELALERRTGREHVADEVRTLLDSRGWRDVQADFRTRSEASAAKLSRKLAERTGRDVEAAPMIRPIALTEEGAPIAEHDGAPLGAPAELAPLGALAEAERRRSGREPVPTGADVEALADVLADVLGADRSAGERDALSAALAAGMPPLGVSVRSDVLAAERGISPDAMRKRISRGNALVRELVPDSRELVALVRASAAVADAGRAPRGWSALVHGRPAPLSALAVAAEAATERARSELRGAPVRRSPGMVRRDVLGGRHGRPRDVLAHIDRVAGAWSTDRECYIGGRPDWTPTATLALKRNVRAGLARPTLSPGRPVRDLSANYARPDVAAWKLSLAAERKRKLAARRDRVGVAARRAYHAEHPATWTTDGAKRAERDARAAVR